MPRHLTHKQNEAVRESLNRLLEKGRQVDVAEATGLSQGSISRKSRPGGEGFSADSGSVILKLDGINPGEIMGAAPWPTDHTAAGLKSWLIERGVPHLLAEAVGLQPERWSLQTISALAWTPGAAKLATAEEWTAALDRLEGLDRPAQTAAGIASHRKDVHAEMADGREEKARVLAKKARRRERAATEAAPAQEARSSAPPPPHRRRAGEKG